MTAVTALIADDEEAPRAQLVAAVHEVWPELQIVAEAASGVDAWDAWLEREPQVCLLDVRMPGLTGIEVAQRIGRAAHVVFVTAPADHALAAFDAGAVDYVLKPVDAARLAPVLARVQARLAATDAAPSDLQDLLDRLAGQVRKPAPLEVIPAGVGRETHLVPLDRVVWFEADARYTRVVHADGEELIRTPLKELIAQLDARQFRQIHRGVIVNRQHVAGTLRGDDGQMLVTLRERPERLPVARHFQGMVQSLFGGS